VLGFHRGGGADLVGFSAVTAATDDASVEGGPDEEAVDLARAGRSLRRGLISLAVPVAIVAGLAVAVPGLHRVGHEIARMRLGWVGVAIGLEALSVLGYVLAFWQVFERAPRRLGARVALSEQAFGAAVSLGGAGGTAVGAWLLVDRGGRMVRVLERSAVLFLLTSAVNVITLVLAGLGLYIGVLPGPRAPVLSIVPAAVGVATLAFFLAVPHLVDPLARAHAPGRVQTALSTTAASVRDTERMLFSLDWRIVGAIGYLWFDIGVLAACFAATGHTPPLAALVLAYLMGYLANVVPIPGGIGVLDGSLVGMLVLYGMNATTALSATIVYHAIALWIPTLWGTCAFLSLRRSRGQRMTLRPMPNERSDT
jgi:uncharacterized membrane protein YbhN (UPF0104 family)